MSPYRHTRVCGYPQRRGLRPPQLRQQPPYLLTLRLDDVQQLLRRTSINLYSPVRIHRLQVVVPLLQLLALNRPTILAVRTRRQQLEKLLEVIQRKRLALRNLHIRKIVVPSLTRRLTFVKEHQISLDTRTRLCKNPSWQADDAVKVAFIKQLPLRLHKRTLRCPEQQTLIYHDPCSTFVRQAIDDLLQKQHLRRTRLISVLLVRVSALLPTKRRIHKNHIEGAWRICVKTRVVTNIRKGISVPDIRLVYAVQNQIRQADWIYQILFLLYHRTSYHGEIV